MSERDDPQDDITTVTRRGFLVTLGLLPFVLYESQPELTAAQELSLPQFSGVRITPYGRVPNTRIFRARYEVGVPRGTLYANVDVPMSRIGKIDQSLMHRALLEGRALLAKRARMGGASVDAVRHIETFDINFHDEAWGVSRARYFSIPNYGERRSRPW